MDKDEYKIYFTDFIEPELHRDFAKMDFVFKQYFIKFWNKNKDKIMQGLTRCDAYKTPYLHLSYNFVETGIEIKIKLLQELKRNSTQGIPMKN